MPLFDRNSRKISYALDRTGWVNLLICIALMMFLSFFHWFLRGFAFASARQELDNTYHWSMIFVLSLGMINCLSGIKITDRTDDRD